MNSFHTYFKDRCGSQFKRHALCYVHTGQSYCINLMLNNHNVTITRVPNVKYDYHFKIWNAGFSHIMEMISNLCIRDIKWITFTGHILIVNWRLTAKI